MPGAYGALGVIRRELRSTRKRLQQEQDKVTRLQKAEQALLTGDDPTDLPTRRARGRPRGRTRARNGRRRAKAA